MTNTTNPACPLCGMRFGSRPLLDLHIRDDHRQRAPSGLNDDHDPGSARAPQQATGSTAGTHEVREAAAARSPDPNATTGGKRKHSWFAGQAMAALRRAVRTGRARFSSAA